MRLKAATPARIFANAAAPSVRGYKERVARAIRRLKEWGLKEWKGGQQAGTTA